MKNNTIYYHYDMIKDALLKLGTSSQDVLHINYILDNIDYEIIEEICDNKPYTKKGVNILSEQISEIMKQVDYKILCNESKKYDKQNIGDICPICEQEKLQLDKYSNNKQVYCNYCENSFIKK